MFRQHHWDAQTWQEDEDAWTLEHTSWELCKKRIPQGQDHPMDQTAVESATDGQGLLNMLPNKDV
jgi:hypothetical protein